MKKKPIMPKALENVSKYDSKSYRDKVEALDSVIRYRKKIQEWETTKNTAKEAAKNVSKADSIIPTEIELEINLVKKSIFNIADKFRKADEESKKRKALKNIEKEQSKEELDSLSDGKSRIAYLKNKLNKIRSRP